MAKPFFITIDTEGDALWSNPKVNNITTNNVLWIPRFQELCEKYGFVPIWLTDWEIANDYRFVEYMKKKVQSGLCEIGIHLHAQNTPPIVQLENEEEGAAYLIEYPDEIIAEKFLKLKKKLENTFEVPIITHRAGRWALNDKYIDILIENGIKYDCSVTPGIDWTSFRGILPTSHGANYTGYKCEKQNIWNSTKTGSLIEYPVTILACDRLIKPNILTVDNFCRAAYHFLKKSKLWLRPNNHFNLNEMKWLINTIIDKDKEYAEFMIHSSELMPGGSPSFDNEEMIEKLYICMDKLFIYARNQGFEGYTFKTWEKELGL